MNTTQLRVTEILRRYEGVAAGEEESTRLATELAELVSGAERMRRSEAAGEVAAAIAQELRSPLFGISAAAQLLRFRAHDDPVLETNVGRILREVERLNRMTSALLELGRPLQPELADTDPDDAWDDVIQSHRGLLESRSLQLNRTRAQPPATCSADSSQLIQAFTHILVNAAEAAPEASDLKLVSHVLAAGGWECRLSNGGTPLATADLARAFDLFFSTKPGGSGLGLTLARRIIEAQRGAVAMESSKEGTTVAIFLPAAA
jgi:signal transduction histidine kinase